MNVYVYAPGSVTVKVILQLGAYLVTACGICLFVVKTLLTLECEVF